jgi:hypothetical protein
MRLVTRRSLEGGVRDYCYNMCQRYNYQGKGKLATLKWTNPSNGNCDQLQCLVFIPTSIQTTVSGSNHSLGFNDSIEIIRNGWTVKDYQSFQPSSHLTKKSLATTIVESAVFLHYNLGATGGQNSLYQIC